MPGMPDPSLGDLVANEIGQNVLEWTIQQAVDASRIAQLAILAAAALAGVTLLAGALLYPGTAAIACFVVSGILVASIALMLFVIAVIRGS